MIFTEIIAIVFQICHSIKADNIGNQDDDVVHKLRGNRNLKGGPKGFSKGGPKGFSKGGPKESNNLVDNLTYILIELVGQPQPFTGQEPSITFDHQLFQLFPSPPINGSQNWISSCVLVDPNSREYLCNFIISFSVVGLNPPSQIMASGPVIFPNQFGLQQFPPVAITGGTGFFVGAAGTIFIDSSNILNNVNINQRTIKISLL